MVPRRNGKITRPRCDGVLGQQPHIQGWGVEPRESGTETDAGDRQTRARRRVTHQSGRLALPLATLFTRVRRIGILRSSGGGARLSARLQGLLLLTEALSTPPPSRLTPSSYRSEAASNSWCQNSCERPSSRSTSRAKYSGWPHLPQIVPVSPRHSGRSPDSPTRTLTPMRACSGLTSLAPLPPLSADRLPKWQVDRQHRVLPPQAIVVEEFVEKVCYLALLVQPA